MTPHRAEPITATVSLVVDGVPYSADVVLSPSTGPSPRSRTTTALRVVQDAPREYAICKWCEHAWDFDLRCGALGGRSRDNNPDGDCKLYAPTLWTRLRRTLRLGRKSVPL